MSLIIQCLYRGFDKWSFREETRNPDKVLNLLRDVRGFDARFKAEVLAYRIVTKRGTILLEEDATRNQYV
jgi:hypothetical protein